MKQLKRLMGCLLIAALVFSLCGCSALDALRESQCFFDGEDILRNGQIYRKLPSCDTLYPELDYEQAIYVTEDDVPVLLSPLLAKEHLLPSLDGAFLSNRYGVTIYCREDLYDSIVDNIRNGFTPEIVCYSYNVYDEDSFDVKEEFYTLTKEQTDVLSLITSTMEPEVWGEGWSLNCQWYINLEECTQDRLFRQSQLEIGFTGKTYYLTLYTDTRTLVFTVPDGCKAMLDDITKAYRDSWDQSWEEDDFV